MEGEADVTDPAFFFLVNDPVKAIKVFVFLNIPGLDIMDKIVIKELGDFKINLSVGIAFFGAGRQSRFESLYREADFAMYESKKIHGNSMTFFDDLNFDFDDIRR